MANGYKTVSEVMPEGQYSSLAIALDMAMVVPTECNPYMADIGMTMNEYRYLMLHDRPYEYLGAAEGTTVVSPTTTARTVR
jgi:hypothetical protein